MPSVEQFPATRAARIHRFEKICLKNQLKMFPRVSLPTPTVEIFEERCEKDLCDSWSHCVSGTLSTSLSQTLRCTMVRAVTKPINFHFPLSFYFSKKLQVPCLPQPRATTTVSASILPISTSSVRPFVRQIMSGKSWGSELKLNPAQLGPYH